MNLTLDTSVQYVPRVGPRMAALLSKLGILNVKELLYYVPFRYNDYRASVPIRSVSIGQTVSVRGTVDSIKNIFTKTGKRLQQAYISDDSGRIAVIWFNQMYLPKVIHPGDELSLAGTVNFFGAMKAMISPDYEIIHVDKTLLSTGRLVPVYSQICGLTSKWMRGRIDFLLENVLSQVTDTLPEDIRKRHDLMELTGAIRAVHFPTDLNQADTARRRLAFDELTTLMLTSYLHKKSWREEKRASVFSLSQKDHDTFIKSLPFELTTDQTNACSDISTDLTHTYPMNRLLLGDVGSGKTVISAYAMYEAWKNGFSCCMMAPTQILAEQHFHTIQALLEPFGISVHLILGNMKGKNLKTQNSNPKQYQKLKLQKNTKYQIPDTKYQIPSIFIGTHALLQEKIELQNVGLVVIDEQQRFGVKQRTLIKNKGSKDMTPHFLTMTATPIPRTIALTLYGNLDLSVLHEMPKGRVKIKTWVVPKEKRNSAYDWIRKHIQKEKSRAFIVCPFIDESESMSSVKAAKKEFEILTHSVFPNLSLGLLHGKLAAKEKTQTLDDFRNGKTHILVSTPVVEVGIDIREASIMLIEGADRFGLSQLHQLRGRVGRGDRQSFCLLFTENDNAKSLERLKILEKVQNGPELADFDLTLRGEGDVFGVRQHGLPPLVLASLSDKEMVEEVKQTVNEITRNDPSLSKLPLLSQSIKKDTIAGDIQD